MAVERWIRFEDAVERLCKLGQSAEVASEILVEHLQSDKLTARGVIKSSAVVRGMKRTPRKYPKAAAFKSIGSRDWLQGKFLRHVQMLQLAQKTFMLIQVEQHEFDVVARSLTQAAFPSDQRPSFAPALRRRAGRKPILFNKVRAWLSKHYPNGEPDISLSAVEAALKLDKIVASQKTVARALKDIRSQR